MKVSTTTLSNMISATVEYALRAVVMLAYRHGTPMTGEQIAEVAHVPSPYLLKLMQQLVRGGIVLSQRGRGGGFSLARSPDLITIWDIVDAVEPFQRVNACPLGLQEHAMLCPLHRKIDCALEHVEDAFRSTTLAEVVCDCGDSSPLCSEPEVVRLGRQAGRKTSRKRRKQ
jgi:Rrf2 family protein